MTPDHNPLTDHLMLQRGCCWAPGGRYCTIGRELWLNYRAECVAAGGRDTMLTVRHQSPEWSEEIKRRAMALMSENSRRAA